MNVSFFGIGELTATFQASGEVQVGNPVKISGNGVVEACGAANDVPIGVAVSCKDGYAGVQLKGYVRLPAAAGLSVGWKKISLTKDGAVQAGEAGREVLVMDVAEGMCGLML